MNKRIKKKRKKSLLKKVMCRISEAAYNNSISYDTSTDSLLILYSDYLYSIYSLKYPNCNVEINMSLLSDQTINADVKLIPKSLPFSCSIQ